MSTHAQTPLDLAMELAAEMRATRLLPPGAERWERERSEHRRSEAALLQLAQFHLGYAQVHERLTNKVGKLLETVGARSQNGSMPWWDELRTNGHPPSRFCFAIRDLHAELKS